MINTKKCRFRTAQIFFATILILTLILSLSLNVYHHYTGKCAFLSKERDAVIKRNNQILQDYEQLHAECRKFSQEQGIELKSLNCPED